MNCRSRRKEWGITIHFTLVPDARATLAHRGAHLLLHICETNKDLLPLAILSSHRIIDIISNSPSLLRRIVLNVQIDQTSPSLTSRIGEVHAFLIGVILAC